MKRKLKITLGSIAALAPVAAVVSCGTGWTKWNKNNNKDPKTFTYVHNVMDPALYRTRPTSEIEKAWDTSTNILDLEKVNNQFELYTLLGQITKIKVTKSIDEYYAKANWGDFKTYLDSIEKKQTIILKYKTNKTTIDYDLTDTLNKIVKGFDSYVEHIETRPGLESTGYDIARAFDVEHKGLNKNNQPVDFVKVATVGISLITIPIVTDITTFDSEFALQLSKLVNIPKDSFDNFKEFMKGLDKLTDDIWNSNSIKEWIKQEKLNMDVNKDGNVKESSNDRGTFKGNLVISMLKV